MLFEKTAIVTGAASGIGYAVAQALRQEGAGRHGRCERGSAH